MAKFTIEILPDEYVDQICAGYAYARRYDVRKLNEKETKHDFMRRDIVERLKQDALDGLKQKAAADAMAVADNAVPKSLSIQ